MKRMILATVAVAALALAGCDDHDPNAKRADGASTEYQYNGEIDGCKLYRVNPQFGDRFHLAICDRPADTTTTRRVSCGKSCSRQEQTQSVQR